MQVSVAEAKARLSELLAAAHHRGERILIRRHGKPYAWIISYEELERLEQDGPVREMRQGLLAMIGLADYLTDEEWKEFDRYVREARENAVPSPPIEFDEPPTDR